MSERKLITDERAEEDKECAICREEINEGSFTTACGHTFHRNCLIRWKNINIDATCPLCRGPLPYISPLPVEPEFKEPVHLPVEFYHSAYSGIAIPSVALPYPAFARLESLWVPFASYPSDYQPSGQINISRAREYYLNIMPPSHEFESERIMEPREMTSSC